MLDTVDRTLVEDIRYARTVKIIINEGTSYERSYTFDKQKSQFGFGYFLHELRLAVQNFINYNKKQQLNSKLFREERKWN